MIEDKVWSEDPAKYIIGADEVGRGSFAGPICAAAVKINYSHLALLTNVKDSKKLSAKKREEIFSMVEENNIEYSFNESSNSTMLTQTHEFNQQKSSFGSTFGQSQFAGHQSSFTF